MSMLKKTKLFWHDSDETNYKAVEGESGRFDLYLNNLLIGTLTYDHGTWRYVYSDEFKQQSEYAPLVNFPDSGQEYVSTQLWPFFASRLPGNTQIDNSTNEYGIVELLRKYGKHVITNAYTLQSPQMAL